MRANNLMIVQGGGPTTVFNASLSSVIAEGLCHPGIGRVFGSKSGVEGIIKGDVLDLSQMSASELFV